MLKHGKHTYSSVQCSEALFVCSISLRSFLQQNVDTVSVSSQSCQHESSPAHNKNTQFSAVGVSGHQSPSKSDQLDCV